jgi:putative alpha-1,2-mannosidase
MSSWYIFSSLGFYPVNPANGKYVIGSPVFDEAVLRITGGKEFKIKTINNSRKNIYVQEVTLNGRKYTKTFITYREIMRGGEMILTLGPEPSRIWGRSREDWATSPVDSD